MNVDVPSAIRLSLGVGLVSTALGLVPAVLLGRWLARTRSPLRPAVSASLLAPMVLPPVVTGLLLLELFSRQRPVGAALLAWGVPVTFSAVGAVIAAGLVGFPLYVLAVRQAFEAVDPRYEDVAATLGDPPAAVFRRVSLPLALPGVAAGAVLAFARGLGEFGATIVVAGNIEGQTRTIALAMYTLLDGPPDDPRLGALLAASVVMSTVALLLYELLSWWQRRRVEQG